METCYHTLAETVSDANFPRNHKTFLFCLAFYHCENTKLKIATKGLVGFLKYFQNIIPTTPATCRKAWHASLFRMRAYRDVQTLREASWRHLEAPQGPKKALKSRVIDSDKWPGEV